MKRKNLTDLSLSHLFSDIDVSNFSCLDLFAQDGKRQSHFFCEKVKRIEMWEIDKEVASLAASNFPNAKVVNCDSIARIAGNEYRSDYNLILIDNPLSTYCDDKYCENFDVITQVYKCFDSETLCLLNIVTEPFNMDDPKNKKWKDRRTEFYSKVDVTIEEAVKRYTDEFSKSGISVERVNFSEREEFGGKVYLYHALFLLKNLKNHSIFPS